MRKLICILLLIFSNDLLASSVKPFWTEKSSYIEGEYLYVVGVATNTASIEKGRGVAFENGKQEIMNFSQLSKIEGITVETQMTFEEEAGNGKYNVFRLMFVDYNKLNSLISKNIEKTKINYEKHQKKQEQEIKIKKIALSKIKKNTHELTKLDVEYNKIANKIGTLSEKALRYVKVGMTMDEVRKLLGKERAYSGKFISGQVAYNYGKYWVIASGDTRIVRCVSTFRDCLYGSSSIASTCNDDKTICKDLDHDWKISYFYRMFE